MIRKRITPHHIIVLVRKPSEFRNTKNRKLKEFIVGVIKGWELGEFLAYMDEFERHLVCERCSNKIIEG
nr:hypothetical protein [Enterovibrio norvegicus]